MIRKDIVPKSDHQLRNYLKKYIPGGWVEPLSVVCSIPYFLDEEIGIMEEKYSGGELEEYLNGEGYKACIIWGIMDFFKEKFNDNLGN